MGQSFGCPVDFQSGGEMSPCIAKCPAGFKYGQVRKPGLPIQTIDRCTLFTDSTKGFDLVNQQPYDTTKPEPPWFATERARVSAAAAALPSVAQFQDDATAATRNYETIKSQYAGYSVESDVSAKMKEVSDSLRVRHVQPVPLNDGIREKILNTRSMSVIQSALFTILLALVEFLVLPGEYASYVVFLTLCVGASAGIYLTTR